jgi:hypothetical protein
VTDSLAGRWPRSVPGRSRRERAKARETSSLIEVTRTLEEAKDVLRGYEVAALAGIAAKLAEAAESVAHTAGELHEMSREEWMTPEQAARHLTCTSTKAFHEVVAKEGVPRHYISDRLPRYSRSELDKWLGTR